MGRRMTVSMLSVPSSQTAPASTATVLDENPAPSPFWELAVATRRRWCGLARALPAGRDEQEACSLAGDGSGQKPAGPFSGRRGNRND